MLNLILWASGLEYITTFKNNIMNAFKKIGLLLIIVLFGLQSAAISQSWFYFQGRVTDIDSLEPLAYYPVYFEGYDTICRVTFTNDTGYYLDSVYANPATFNYAEVSVEDCLGEMHTKEFMPPEQYNVANFEICEWQDQCQALFYYQQDFDNPYLFNFFDLSQGGEINKWTWDFGDFSFSNEINPVHEYEEAGFYQVLLTVEDTNGNCWSFYEESVFIDDTINCTADFIVTLDTLNNIPNSYFFTDNSIGNIDSWFWDFGDGYYSDEQNPVHVYDEGGDYLVCLSITGGGDAGSGCWDEKCTEVSTAQYFTFGGHVFIDGFPINIEESDSSNIATAFLYRRFENQWKYMDEREFWKFGYYWFVEKPEGEYLLRVDLHEGSVDFGNYAPSYYGGGTNWVYSAAFGLEDNNQVEVNINLQELGIMQSGTGSISGYLEQRESCDEVIDLYQQIVKLFDDGGNLIDFTYSKQNGVFEFASLADGSYKIQAEITGRTSTFEYATINSQNPFSDGHVLEIDCDAYVGVNETTMADNAFVVKDIFPIPANEFVNLRIQSFSALKSEIEIVDLMGKILSVTTLDVDSGENLITLNLNKLQSGVFVFRIKSLQGQTLSTGKILHIK